MDTELIITSILTAGGTALGYIFGNRKNKAEAAKLEIQNFKDIISVYTEAIQDLKDEVNELKDKITKYQKHIEKLETELCDLRKDMRSGDITTPSRRRKSIKSKENVDKGDRDE